MEVDFKKYRQQIWELAEAILDAEGMELVEVECLKMPSRWLVRVFIDRDGGVKLDDCVYISNQLGDVLDVHDVPPGAYTLEVSSPGLDRPLVKDADFRKYLGYKVDIKLNEKLDGSRRFKGELTDFLENDHTKFLVVDVSGKSYRIPREMIAKAQLVYKGQSTEGS